MKRPTSLTLSEDVREALDTLAERHDFSRSWLANHLIREGLATNAAATLSFETASPAQQQPT
jgi:predicted transcriptional regulator